jgi:hypothetical protein
MVNVVVTRGRQINVAVPSEGTVLSGKSVTIRNDTSLSATGASRLDQLEDVLESSPTNNSTLVYDSATDKYVVQQINLDGGTF